ncbi:MAG: DUF3786 domain-containing protein [Treponema sp.]|nr:DUF3786 domain-containing protein [Treponema sp.]
MGYDDALNLAMQKLSQIKPETVCGNCGVRYEGGEYFLSWFNMEKSLSNASVPHKILWLHYMTADGSKKEAGQLMSYREAAPALFYEPNFNKRAVRPLVNCFGKNPEKLIETGLALGGQKALTGDTSIKANVLPYLPLTFVIWKGCDEFPPGGNILFDKSAKTWFPPEDLAVLASFAVYELIGASKRL